MLPQIIGRILMITDIAANVMVWVSVEKAIREGLNGIGTNAKIPQGNSTDTTDSSSDSNSTVNNSKSNISLSGYLSRYIDFLAEKLFNIGNIDGISNSTIMFSMYDFIRNYNIIEILIEAYRNGVIVKKNGTISCSAIIKNQLILKFMDIFRTQCANMSRNEISHYLGVPDYIADCAFDYLLIKNNNITKPYLIYDNNLHHVWSEAQQKDIMGRELIYTKPAICKIKDKDTDMHAYCLVFPNDITMDLHIDISEKFGDFNDLYSLIKKVIPYFVNNTNMKWTPIPFEKLNVAIQQVYGN